MQNAFTLINPQTGNLAFKVFDFEDNSPFDHLQRLGYYSVILIREGTGTLKADVAEYDFNGNLLLFFSPYQPFMISSQGKMAGMVLNFHPDFFCIHKHHHEVACHGVLFNNLYQPPFLELVPAETAVFSSQFEQMKAEVPNTALAQYEMLVSYLKIFLITASRLKVSHNPEKQPSAEQVREPFVLQSLKNAIEQHYRTKHTASEYADLLNISAKALARISKTHFNRTLTHLISERIIIEAKRELYLTAKPVKAIAYELGFSDEYYFSRFFKTNASVSPQFYRDTVGFARGE